ncbi:MAG: phosphoadenosine phosphosulfate reductase family protein, partial [Bacteroidales bacterium]
MKIYKNATVIEEALKRINFLFDEFPNIVVGYSGGKDSTVCVHLCLQVARERNRLPLSVMWIDQEAEWQGTVDIATEIMTNSDVKPYWFQMPMVITNNASSFSRYSNCWEEGKDSEWIHPKHPLSIKENKYGTNRFHELFEAIFKVEFPGIKSCYISGVRCEESPKRAMSLTQVITYKYVTWGKVLSKKNQHYTFYPIYDWSYTDVWKTILDWNLNYNRVYDGMYQHGVPLQEMRISNVHHETAIRSLLIIQEIEPITWEKVSSRIDGANAIKHLNKECYTCPKTLPYMFSNWNEYAMHLLENIIQEDKNKRLVLRVIKKWEKVYVDTLINEAFYKKVIDTILCSDWDLTKIDNFNIRIEVYNYRKFKKGIVDQHS